MKGYRLAWVQRDPDAAAALFTPNAVYQEQAFQPAYVGREAIRGYWETVTATQSDIELRYGRAVVARRKAAVERWVNLRNGGAEVTLAGEFLLTFARGGLCKSLREYWFFTEGHLAPPPGWGE
jgi:SnoaL-like domain